jgi:hypothetical protein
LPEDASYLRLKDLDEGRAHEVELGGDIEMDDPLFGENSPLQR